MLKARSNLGRIAGFIAVMVMVVAGVVSAHARPHVVTVPAVKAAPCHDQAKSAPKSDKDLCQEICASGLPDQSLTAVAPVVRSPVLVAPVVYETPRAVFVPSTILLSAVWWHPPPSGRMPIFLRHQRLLI